MMDVVRVVDALKLATQTLIECADKIKRLKEENERLRSRCAPNHVVIIGDTGHYVNDAVYAHIEELKAKLDTANALVTCCCGSPVDTHGMGDGHSPVGMYHYRLMQIEKENDRLKSLLCLADEVLMTSHGCFPLDRVTADQRYLNDAAKAIRAVTGEDYAERKRLAASALEASR